jgi:predicted patatin/cPLA2 family phospholipase
MKIGIIDVGGGLRDIFGAGVFDYLLDKEIFIDFLIGISAGSGNVITYMSKQRGRNYKSYMFFSKRKKYMSVNNYLKNRNYVNLDYIYNELASENGELPFDYDTFSKSRSDCLIVVSNAKTGEPEYFNKKSIRKDDYGVCAASSNLPIMNKPYPIKDNLYYDGSITDPIPIQKCYDAGCDKIIVILTRPIDFRKKDEKHPKLYKRIRTKYPEFTAKLDNRSKLYNDQLDAIISKKDDNILIIAPDETEGLKTLTKNYDKMELLYKSGYKKGKIIEDFLNKKTRKANK